MNNTITSNSGHSPSHLQVTEKSQTSIHSKSIILFLFMKVWVNMQMHQYRTRRWYGKARISFGCSWTADHGGECPFNWLRETSGQFQGVRWRFRGKNNINIQREKSNVCMNHCRNSKLNCFQSNRMLIHKICGQSNPKSTSISRRLQLLLRHNLLNLLLRHWPHIRVINSPNNYKKLSTSIKE